MELTVTERPSKLIVTDLARVNLATEETRHEILKRLVIRAMTSRELSAELTISQQLVYHHLQKLIKAGLVEVSQVDKRGNRDVFFYRAVAPEITFALPELRGPVALAAEPVHA
ncbi:MAG: ArsR/SmtB family transcription factor [Methanobacteriota archaeon]